MKRNLYNIVFFIMIAVSYHASSQVSVNFNASLYGRSLDGLSFAQIISVYPTIVFAKIKITVREMRQGPVVTINVPYRQYKTGLNIINSREFTNSNFVFARNAPGTQLSQTGKFADGEYDYCFEVTVGDPKTQAVNDISEFCFQSTVEPITPLLLIDPAPDDKFCNTRPGFTWEPPVPLQRGAQYRIIVCEKPDKQTDIEAITYNIPVINIGGIYVNTLPFPAKTPDLKKDKKYVWQVTVYQEKTILTKSEIWQFEIKCEEYENRIYRPQTRCVEFSYRQTAVRLLTRLLHGSRGNPNAQVLTSPPALL